MIPYGGTINAELYGTESSNFIDWLYDISEYIVAIPLSSVFGSWLETCNVYERRQRSVLIRYRQGRHNYSYLFRKTVKSTTFKRHYHQHRLK